MHMWNGFSQFSLVSQSLFISSSVTFFENYLFLRMMWKHKFGLNTHPSDMFPSLVWWNSSEGWDLQWFFWKVHLGLFWSLLLEQVRGPMQCETHLNKQDSHPIPWTGIQSLGRDKILHDFVPSWLLQQYMMPARWSLMWNLVIFLASTTKTQKRLNTSEVR